MTRVEGQGDRRLLTGPELLHRATSWMSWEGNNQRYDSALHRDCIEDRVRGTEEYTASGVLGTLEIDMTNESSPVDVTGI